MGRLRTNVTNWFAARASRTLASVARRLLTPASKQRFDSIAKRVLAWFRARSLLVQIVVVLFALAFGWVLWSVLVVVVGFLLRAVIWQWLKAEVIARLLQWGRQRVRPGS